MRSCFVCTCDSGIAHAASGFDRINFSLMTPCFFLRHRIIDRKEIDNIGYLVIGHKAALDTVWLRQSLREKEHVTLSKKLLRSVHIQNGSGIHAG